MDEAGRKIEIFKPFGEAFELTKKILFQPFDIGKWFVIGFAAFLAGLSDGTHASFSGRFPSNSEFKASAFTKNISTIHDQIAPWIIPVIVVAGVIFVAFVFLMMWLGSRGRFMFVDCIVRNRGAVQEPWREFRQEGNSFFLFSLLTMLISLGLLAILALPFVLRFLIYRNDNVQFDAGGIIGAIFAACLYVLFALGWLLISFFMIPVMYRRRCRATIAFLDVAKLIAHDAGPFVLYFLFGFLLAIAGMILSCFVMCATCCVAMLPYIGTVILLPIYVFYYSYTLLFLRQFGSEYDAWGNIIPPEPPPVPEALTA